MAGKIQKDQYGDQYRNASPTDETEMLLLVDSLASTAFAPSIGRGSCSYYGYEYDSDSSSSNTDEYFDRYQTAVVEQKGNRRLGCGMKSESVAKEAGPELQVPNRGTSTVAGMEMLHGGLGMVKMATRSAKKKRETATRGRTGDKRKAVVELHETILRNMDNESHLPILGGHSGKGCRLITPRSCVVEVMGATPSAEIPLQAAINKRKRRHINEERPTEGSTVTC